MAKTAVINNFKMYLIIDRHYKPSTIKNYMYEIEIFYNYINSKSIIINYEAVNFTDYLMFRAAKSKGTTNNIIKALKVYYNYLAHEKIITKNIGDALEMVDVGKKIPRILDCYQLHCIFEQFDNAKTETDLRNAAVLETLYSTGCRINEVLTMEVGIYNATSTVIGKNDAERIVLFNSLAKKRIEKYLAVRKNKSKLLFTNLKGGKLSAKYVNKIIDEVCKAAEVPFKVTAHTFRHTFASHLYEGGANIIEIKELLGHRTVTTTEIYTTYVGVELLRKELQLNHPRW